MYWSLFARTLASVAVALMIDVAAEPAAAQSSLAPQLQPGATRAAGTDEAQPQHDMQHMHMEDDQRMAMPAARVGSGTSWLPDETPMYAVHTQAGDWTLMAHGNAFVQYLHDTGGRGSHQAGSINWFMGMADRNVGTSHLG